MYPGGGPWAERYWWLSSLWKNIMSPEDVHLLRVTLQSFLHFNHQANISKWTWTLKWHSGWVYCRNLCSSLPAGFQMSWLTIPPPIWSPVYFYRHLWVRMLMLHTGHETNSSWSDYSMTCSESAEHRFEWTSTFKRKWFGGEHQIPNRVNVFWKRDHRLLIPQG